MVRSRIVVVAGRAAALALSTVVVFGIGASGAEAAAASPAPISAVGANSPDAGSPGAQAVGSPDPQNDGESSKASVGLDDGIGGGVGIAAVILGIGGMAVGVYRRRRGLAAQAEGNQRR